MAKEKLTKEISHEGSDFQEFLKEEGIDISDTPSSEELFYAEFLKGSAELFSDISDEVKAKMISHGLAADMGEGTLARGFQWHKYFG